MARRRPAPSVRVAALGHGDLRTSLLLIVPLFLAYQIGVLFSSTINGVDFVTRTVFAAVGRDRELYLLVHLVVAVGFAVWVVGTRRRQVFRGDVILPLVLEAAIYALTLGTAIVVLMEHVLGFDGVLALGRAGEALVVSLGAGVHEELVFRLGLMSGGLALLLRARLDPRLALALALAGSALLFSAAHHVGPHGEAFTAVAFTYRALAGVAFGLIYYHRSLAHAVYAHVLYDLYVLLIRG